MQSDQSRALTGFCARGIFFCPKKVLCGKMWESDLSSIGFGLSNIICHRDRGCQCHPILDPILDPRHPLLFQLLSYFWSKTFMDLKPIFVPQMQNPILTLLSLVLLLHPPGLREDWKMQSFDCFALIEKCNLFLQRQPSNQNATWTEAASQSLRERTNKPPQKPSRTRLPATSSS